MNFTGKYSLLNLLYGTPTEIQNQFKQATLNSTQKLTLSDRKDFENGMIQRQKFISQRCKKIPEEIFKENYEPEVYCPFNNLMYCPVHKASSTMWYENLMILWVHQSVSVFNNLFMTSKNETTNSPIHEFKVLQNVFKM